MHETFDTTHRCPNLRFLIRLFDNTALSIIVRGVWLSWNLKESGVRSNFVGRSSEVWRVLETLARILVRNQQECAALAKLVCLSLDG